MNAWSVKFILDVLFTNFLSATKTQGQFVALRQDVPHRSITNKVIISCAFTSHEAVKWSCFNKWKRHWLHHGTAPSTASRQSFTPVQHTKDGCIRRTRQRSVMFWLPNNSPVCLPFPSCWNPHTKFHIVYFSTVGLMLFFLASKLHNSLSKWSCVPKERLSATFCWDSNENTLIMVMYFS